MSKHPTIRTLGVLSLIICLMTLFVFGCSSPQEPSSEQETHEDWPRSIVIASGPTGGPWYPTMVKCSEILMREIPGLTVNVIEGGAESNIRLVDEGVDAQIGMTSSAILHPAIEGTGDYKADNITAIGAVLTSYAQIGVLADSSIYSINDLANKRVAPGKHGFISEVIFSSVLDAYGFTYDDIRNNGGSVSYVAWSEYASLMKDNHIDAFCLCGEIPHSSIMEIEASKPVRLLPIEPDKLQAVLDKYPYLFATEMPAGIYEGQKEPVTLLGYSGVLIANKSLPEDFLAKIIEVLVEHKDEIVNELPFVDLLSWERIMSGLTDEVMSPEVLKLINSKKK